MPAGKGLQTNVNSGSISDTGLWTDVVVVGGEIPVERGPLFLAYIQKGVGCLCGTSLADGS